MKTGLFFSHVQRMVKDASLASEAHAIEQLVPLGLQCVDINGGNVKDENAVRELTRIFDSFGITSSSTYYLEPFNWRDEGILDVFREKTKAQLELGARLGAKIFMPVPDVTGWQLSDSERAECQKKVIEYFNEAARMSKEYGISTVIENYSDYRNPYSTLSDFDIIFEKTSGVDYVLDTGNFWFTDTDFLSVYDKFHAITRHIHLKDILPNEDGFLKINGKACDSDELGGGIIDFKGLFERISKYGYDGALSIEISNPENITDKIIRSLKYVQKLRGGINA